MIAFLAALLLAGSQQATPAVTAAPIVSFSRVMPLLLCDASTSCDMHFVADDWAGSGNWTSRDSNAWAAVVNGSPTKSLAPLLGHASVGGFSASNFFATAANAAHSISAATTYEVVFSGPAAASYQMLIAAGTAFNTPGLATTIGKCRAALGLPA